MYKVSIFKHCNKLHLAVIPVGRKIMKQAPLPPNFPPEAFCTPLYRGVEPKQNQNSLAVQREQRSKIRIIEVMDIIKVSC